mmetsp:Transcript_13217/g.22648  ORF Transcript_13217/g.22648 Transcript_13217/m.22648 type:complete len:103 (+) Transcript_13217:369-677(+)
MNTYLYTLNKSGCYRTIHFNSCFGDSYSISFNLIHSSASQSISPSTFLLTYSNSSSSVIPLVSRSYSLLAILRSSLPNDIPVQFSTEVSKACNFFGAQFRHV